MLLPFQFRHRFVPAALCSQVGADTFQAFGDVLVYLDLLVHVEVWQPVVHHNHRGDVVEGVPRLSGNVVPYLDGATFAVAVGQDGKLVSGFQVCFLDELPHHIGRHVSIDGIDNADFVRLKGITVLFHQLRDAEQFGVFVCQFAGNVEAVACPCEIEDNAFFCVHIA